MRHWMPLALLIAGSIAVGAAISETPLVVLGALFGILTLALGWVFRDHLPRLFLLALGIALLGYAFFDRAFSYLGVPPIFVGEMVLALGVFSALTNKGLFAAFRSPLAWLLVPFVLWGIARTIPFLPVYHFDALRDAVVWGYAAFAIVIPAALYRSPQLTSVPKRYARWIPLFALWVPLGLAFNDLLKAHLPHVPGTTEAMDLVRPSNAGAHLAGAAALLLLGLHHWPQERAKAGPKWTEWFVWAVLLGAVVYAGALNRGGFLAVIAAVLVVATLRPVYVGRKVVLVAAIAIMLFSSLVALDVSIDVGGRGSTRNISARQIASNIESIIDGGSGNKGNLDATREWRLRWWRRIIAYTIHGPYFWDGKGFGVNLAVDDGMLPPNSRQVPNRNPHNDHMTVLARMGVTGLLFWIALEGAVALSLARAYFRARRVGQDWWARLDLWLLAYWIALNVNMTFTVYIEGPYGGVWFWSLIGFVIATLEAQRPLVTAHAARRPLPYGTRLTPSAPRPIYVGTES